MIEGASDEQLSLPTIIQPASTDHVRLILKNAMSRLPQISLLAVFLTAVFNVGYYTEIGLHFIGLMDFTNFVYSFALIFLIFIMAMQGAFGLAESFLKFSTQPDAAWARLRKINLVGFGLILFFGAIILSAPKDISPIKYAGNSPAPTADLYAIFAIMQVTAGYLWFKLGIFTLADVGYVGFPVIFAVFSMGKVIAYNQIFSTQHYTLTTEKSVIAGAALVRTSPEGFLIAHDGTIMFIPMREVSTIEAENKIEP